MSADRTRRALDDSGMGLIELIVAMVVGGIVVAGVATVFVNSWTTQDRVTSLTQATDRGQLVASTVERAVRNAVAIDVSPDGTELRVRTTLDGSLACQGFRLADGSARFVTSTGALPADAATWPEWQTRIQADGSSPYFATDGVTVEYAFAIGTDASPVRFTGTSAARSVLTGVSAPCW